MRPSVATAPADHQNTTAHKTSQSSERGLILPLWMTLSGSRLVSKREPRAVRKSPGICFNCHQALFHFAENFGASLGNLVVGWTTRESGPAAFADKAVALPTVFRLHGC